MYPVTSGYKEKVKESNRLFEAKIQIQHSKGVLDLTDKDLVQGTLAYTESSQSGENFTIGGTVASDISFTILNKLEYENINFIGATVICNIGLCVKEGIDAHFLQPSQPSKMKGFDEKWEYVPLGRFNIDYAPRQRNTIEIKAIDNMINLDKPYSLSRLSYPASLYQIYVDTCNVCDILPGATSFPNMNYVVKARPDGDLTFRDVIGYVAELAGCFAKCNRNGALELRWYTPTDIVIGPENRFNFKPSDDEAKIKGIMVTVEDTTYLAGSEDYAINLTENPLLQGDYKTVLPNIFNNVKDMIFSPYTSEWQGDPAIQAGDMITQIDKDGKVYDTLITKSIYKYRGRSILEAKGLPEISQGYKGSTNRKIAEIKKKIDEEVGVKLTTFEQAQLNATELIANMLGGYAIKTDEAFYIADHKDLSKARKIWKWGIGGFGYSSTGINGPYTMSITADGSIVAMLVAANIITADMVQTGILQSEDGSTWINLDNGAFNFQNLIKLENGRLRLDSPDIPEETDLSGVQTDINNIKNLKPGTLKGGVTTITNERVRVEHGSSNQYSEIRADGFIRKWPYGEANYLNDIYVGVFEASNNSWDYPPPATRITLPQRFRGRQGMVDAFISISSFNTRAGTVYGTGGVFKLNTRIQIFTEVESMNLNTETPYVDVNAYLREDERKVENPDGTDSFYSRINFMLIVVGR